MQRASPGQSHLGGRTPGFQWHCLSKTVLYNVWRMIWGSGFQVSGSGLHVASFGFWLVCKLFCCCCGMQFSAERWVTGSGLLAQFHLLVPGLGFYVASYSCLLAENGLPVKCCSVTRVGRCYNVWLRDERRNYKVIVNYPFSIVNYSRRLKKNVLIQLH